MYHETARDILRRQAFPVVPLLPMQRQRNYIYTIPGSIRMRRSSTVIGPSLLGFSVVVGENCTVSRSVVCNHSHIGDAASIVDSHLWEGVQVEANATIESSILGAGVVIGSGAVISRGCIVGSGCIIGAHVVVPEFTRLTCSAAASGDDGDGDWDSSSDDDDDISAAGETDPDNVVVSEPDLVGSDGVGRRWAPSPDLIDDEYFLPHTIVLQSQCIGFDQKLAIARKLAMQAQADEDSYLANDNPSGNDSLLFNSLSPSIVGRQEGIDVVHELKTICLEYENTSPIENLAIELNSYVSSRWGAYLL